MVRKRCLRWHGRLLRRARRSGGVICRPAPGIVPVERLLLREQLVLLPAVEHGPLLGRRVLRGWSLRRGSGWRRRRLVVRRGSGRRRRLSSLSGSGRAEQGTKANARRVAAIGAGMGIGRIGHVCRRNARKEENRRVGEGALGRGERQRRSPRGRLAVGRSREGTLLVLQSL
jgi:hypothetical protein